jgi:AcrR family transcriptional regulator
MQEASVDGRVARSERTREAIAEALMALLNEGIQRPRAQEIAKRADVAVRTVFQHFDDMEGLYEEILRRQAERIAPYLAPIDPHRSTADKVRALVEMRDNLYAIAAPLRRGMLQVEAANKSATFERALEELRRAMTQQIQQGFVKELHLYTDPYDVLPRIEAITSLEMWDHFIQVQGASRTAVRSHMSIMVMRELQPTG